MFFKIIIFILTFLLCQFNKNDIYTNEVKVAFPPLVITKSIPEYSLINSVEFRPNEQIFCATYTQANMVIIYRITEQSIEEIQRLKHPLSKLSSPQHAIFTPDGKRLIVANWTNETISFYKTQANGLVSIHPKIFPPHKELLGYKPHGITCSPDGCYLAVAYGASSHFDRAVALYKIKQKNLELIDLIKKEELLGIPKGITFSPDGTCLLISFSDANSIGIYSFDFLKEKICKAPLQIIRGSITKISRPEDIKITPNGNFCVVSNSNRHHVTFYHYDKNKNRILNDAPCYMLEKHFHFPHGIAFSSNGHYMLITEFGQIDTTEEEGIQWKKDLPSESAHISVFSGDF